jgi:hypothetical protein
MSKAEAIRRLRARWNEQVELFPSMIRTETALAFYISRNIDMVRRNNLRTVLHRARGIRVSVTSPKADGK